MMSVPPKTCGCAAAVETHGEVSQEDWPIERSAAWQCWVPRCAGTDGTLRGEEGVQVKRGPPGWRRQMKSEFWRWQ